MTDGVDQEEGDVLLVKTEHVVEVAADVTGGAEEDVEVDGAQLGEDLREKILLKARGEAQLFVEAGHVELEGLVAAAKEVDLGFQVVDFTLYGVEVEEGAGGDVLGIGAERLRVVGRRVARLGGRAEGGRRRLDFKRREVGRGEIKGRGGARARFGSNLQRLGCRTGIHGVALLYGISVGWRVDFTACGADAD